MADDTERKRRLWDRIRECLTWSNILDFAYVTWILRAPLVVLAVGLLVLGLAPQAQDLIVDLAAELGRMVLFLALLIAWVWVTIFCSYLLLERDRRLRAHADQISQPPNNPRQVAEALDAGNALSPRRDSIRHRADRHHSIGLESSRYRGHQRA